MRNTVLPQPQAEMTFDPEAHRALATWIKNLKFQTMNMAHELDCFAATVGSSSQLRLLTELASNLELMESQLDYYFPEPVMEMESDEWQDILALLSSSADWLEDQILDIDLQFDSGSLTSSLHSLSAAYSDSIPLVIAARFGHSGRYGSARSRAAELGKPKKEPAEHRFELLEPAI